MGCRWCCCFTQNVWGYVDILKDEREKRVGVYVRVSTDDPRQTSSFELQRNHYTDLIDRYPNWKLYRIYADM